jgi:hypothetical protein
MTHHKYVFKSQTFTLIFISKVNCIFANSKWFWRWCIALGIGNIFLSSRKITGAANLLSRLETASLITGSSHWALPKGPNRVGAPITLPEDVNIFSLQNVVFLKTLDDGRCPKKRDYSMCIIVGDILVNSFCFLNC